jgi:predicted dehydrogenase
MNHEKDTHDAARSGRSVASRRLGRCGPAVQKALLCCPRHLSFFSYEDCMSVEKSIGWGIIGTGRYAHKNMAPAIQQSAKGKLVAVFDIDQEQAKWFANQHGNPSVYGSLDALLEDAAVDAILICTPNHLHKEHALRAAQAGKHVLCEKPLANSVEECRAIIDACNKATVKLATAYNHRHNPLHVAAKEFIASGKIGKPVLIEMQYNHASELDKGSQAIPSWRWDPSLAGGGQFIGAGTHIIDLAHFLLGRKITQVMAMADEGWYSTGCETLAKVTLRFEEQILGSLCAGIMRYSLDYLNIYGTSARMRCTDNFRNGGGCIELTSDQGHEVIHFEKCNTSIREIDAFADSVLLGTDTNASGYDGLMVAKVTKAIYQSLQMKSSVELMTED